MERVHGRQRAERGRALPPGAGWEARRPLLRRVPLVAFFVVAIVCLKYLDGRMSRDYRRSAADLAVQADALIEGGLSSLGTGVHTLSRLLGSAATGREAQERLDVMASELTRAHPEVLRVYWVDARGDVRATIPAIGSTADDLAKDNHLLIAETAEAIARAREVGGPATSGLIVLRQDTLGFLIYDPVVDEGRVTGFVGVSVAYGSLLRSLLTARLADRFGYRIADSVGRTLAVSPQYPLRTVEHLSQTITLPGGRVWQLDVPIGVFQPRTARVVMWVVGIALLFIVFLLILREDARAERIAMHSFNLELLSRDLLDANVRLEERAQQVTEANMAKSRFLANVSHELRTPLNAIVGYNALALSGIYGDISHELRAAHDRIRTAAEHLLRVVNDVLDLSKIEVGRMEVQTTPVSIEPLLEGIVALVEPVAEAKDVRVDLVVSRDVPTVHTDARHVRQILMNLVSNAIKFTERGTVTIVAKPAEGMPRPSVAIAIEDTGIGITGADLERIFEEFEQVRPSGRGDSITRGTGLGLAVSRKLARLVGGDVTVDSQLGAGSRFTLTLPVEAVSASGTDAEIPLTAEAEPGARGRDGGAAGAASGGVTRGGESASRP